MSGPLTISTIRTVREGREGEFERLLHEFVQQSLTMPGQLGVHILRPAPGSRSRDYGIVRKFATRADATSFYETHAFREWLRSCADLTEGEARTEELCGLESWFTLPGEPMRPLPKWKMAVATFAGVLPVAMLLQVTVGHMTSGWSLLPRTAVFGACMVALLTWIVMPLVTRLLHGWLHAPGGASS